MKINKEKVLKNTKTILKKCVETSRKFDEVFEGNINLKEIQLSSAEIREIINSQIDDLFNTINKLSKKETTTSNDIDKFKKEIKDHINNKINEIFEENSKYTYYDT